jgi:hypothetical protein
MSTFTTGETHTPRSASRNALFVVPRGEGDGFQARVRGHVLDLIDPNSYSLAPTADDVFVVSIAATLAWSARSFLRKRGLPDYVSIGAEWRAHEDRPDLSDIHLTLTVSRLAEAVRAELAAALESKLASRLLIKPVLNVSLEG